MLTDKSVSSSYSDCRVARVLGRASELPPRVVVLRGEYDVSSADASWDRLARAIDVDDADFVLHLGEVTFLDASTITVFIRARARLARGGRRFSLRSLSTSAVRITEICTLRCLVEDGAGTSHES